LVFGAGVLWHLLRHGRDYDVVHTASFPYFSVLAAAAARPLGAFRLVVDWHELWSREYWRAYLGAAGGRIGWLVQKARLRGEVTVLSGEYAGALEAPPPEPAEPVVVFAGRHIPEKRAPAAVAGVAA